MELLIPGLILVALMVWASTKIKKTAADAFQAEVIETENYRLEKPDGFLHVIGDPDHEINAYSKDFGTGDKTGTRQATIELDVLRDTNPATVRDEIAAAAADFEINDGTSASWDIETEEPANEIPFSAFYKLVPAGDDTYRLRFAVISEHADDYLRKIQETLESFTVRST